MWGLIPNRGTGSNLASNPDPRYQSCAVASLIADVLSHVTGGSFKIHTRTWEGKTGWSVNRSPMPGDETPIAFITYPRENAHQRLITAATALLIAFKQGKMGSLIPGHSGRILWADLQNALEEQSFQVALAVQVAELGSGLPGAYDWRKEAPTKPGYYWFHGWRNKRYKEHAAKTELVRVWESGNKELVFVVGSNSIYIGSFLYLDECEGVWMYATLPEPPKPEEL